VAGVDETVTVAVRVRPLLARERADGDVSCVVCDPGGKELLVGADRTFGLSKVLPPETSQDDVYGVLDVGRLVRAALDGVNGTVFAYGQTGSGKTHTMGIGVDLPGQAAAFRTRGDDPLPASAGIVPRAVDALFAEISARRAAGDGAETDVSCTFLEVHHEAVTDLLAPRGSRADGVTVREDAAGKVVVAGATRRPAATREELLAALADGCVARTTGATHINAHSSRSHAIFTVQVRRRTATAVSSGGGGDDGAAAPATTTTTARLTLVDLAGSERQKRTQAVGVRFRESVAINQGLLALGNVISALSDEARRRARAASAGGASSGATPNSGDRPPGAMPHIPYRQAKLTRLLQEALGGNSRTVMVACVSSSSQDMDETLNTLKYAQRAMSIRNRPTVNREARAALDALDAASAGRIRSAANSRQLDGLRRHLDDPIGTPLPEGLVAALGSEAADLLVGRLRAAHAVVASGGNVAPEPEAEARVAELLRELRDLRDDNADLLRRLGDSVGPAAEAAAETTAARDRAAALEVEAASLRERLMEATDDLARDEAIFAERMEEMAALRNDVARLEAEVETARHRAEAAEARAERVTSATSPPVGDAVGAGTWLSPGDAEALREQLESARAGEEEAARAAEVAREALAATERRAAAADAAAREAQEAAAAAIARANEKSPARPASGDGGSLGFLASPAFARWLREAVEAAAGRDEAEAAADNLASRAREVAEDSERAVALRDALRARRDAARRQLESKAGELAAEAERLRDEGAALALRRGSAGASAGPRASTADARVALGAREEAALLARAEIIGRLERGDFLEAEDAAALDELSDRLDALEAERAWVDRERAAAMARGGEAERAWSELQSRLVGHADSSGAPIEAARAAADLLVRSEARARVARRAAETSVGAAEARLHDATSEAAALRDTLRAAEDRHRRDVTELERRHAENVHALLTAPGAAGRGPTSPGPHGAAAAVDDTAVSEDPTDGLGRLRVADLRKLLRLYRDQAEQVGRDCAYFKTANRELRRRLQDEAGAVEAALDRAAQEERGASSLRASNAALASQLRHARALGGGRLAGGSAAAGGGVGGADGGWARSPGRASPPPAPALAPASPRPGTPLRAAPPVIAHVVDASRSPAGSRQRPGQPPAEPSTPERPLPLPAPRRHFPVVALPSAPPPPPPPLPAAGATSRAGYDPRAYGGTESSEVGEGAPTSRGGAEAGGDTPPTDTPPLPARTEHLGLTESIDDAAVLREIAHSQVDAARRSNRAVYLPAPGAPVGGAEGGPGGGRGGRGAGPQGADEGFGGFETAVGRGPGLRQRPGQPPAAPSSPARPLPPAPAAGAAGGGRGWRAGPPPARGAAVAAAAAAGVRPPTEVDASDVLLGSPIRGGPRNTAALVAALGTGGGNGLGGPGVAPDRTPDRTLTRPDQTPDQANRLRKIAELRARRAASARESMASRATTLMGGGADGGGAGGPPTTPAAPGRAGVAGGAAGAGWAAAAARRTYLGAGTGAGGGAGATRQALARPSTAGPRSMAGVRATGGRNPRPGTAGPTGAGSRRLGADVGGGGAATGGGSGLSVSGLAVAGRSPAPAKGTGRLGPQARWPGDPRTTPFKTTPPRPGVARAGAGPGSRPSTAYG